MSKQLINKVALVTGNYKFKKKYAYLNVTYFKSKELLVELV